MKGKMIRIRSTMFSFSLNIFGSDLRKCFGYDDKENKEQHKLDRLFIKEMVKLVRQYEKDYRKMIKEKA